MPDPVSSWGLREGALRSWRITVDRAGKLFNRLSEDDLQKEVVSDKNGLVYLWGHLIAINDRMIPLLGLGGRLYLELDAIFIEAPDQAVEHNFSVQSLASMWRQLDDILWERLNALTEAEWLERHTAVSEEEFKRQPHRNRFGVVLDRTNHLSYHLGQAILTRR